MKYDLKRLKNAVDEQIPAIPADEGILDRALAKGKRRGSVGLTRALTAAAACVIVLLMLGSIFMPGMKTRPDNTGNSAHLLSQGLHQTKPTAQPTEESGARQAEEEDLSAYSVYSPDYARSALPETAEFGDVVIRRLDNYDGTFVFEEEESGERVIPGQFDLAYAWFPATDTGLVRLGPNEGMSLVNVLRETLDGQYSHFQYVGNGVAIVADRDEDETEPDPMYLISTADGTKLSREYEIIGTMRSGDVRLLTGHDNQELIGDFDVLSLQGRVIARVGELSGVYFDSWLAVQLPGEAEYCLIDYDGNVQLNGMRFARIAYEKDGMLVVWTDKGSGVIGMDGEWILEPGRYMMIEFAGDGLFRAMDTETGEAVQINRAGEPVDTLSFRLYRLKERIGGAYYDWREGLGELGYIVVCLTAFWLLLRISWSEQNGELLHMLMTELGFAAYIAGLLLIGHRNSGEYVTIFPADTSMEGLKTLSGQWILMGLALTATLIAAYPKLREPKKAFAAGYGMLLLPWAWKAVCADVSVMGWRVFSEAVFLGGALLAVLLFKVGPVKRFMAWCARFDMLNEYARKTRIVWIALIVLALINFGAGSFISGQEMVKCSHRIESQRGLTDNQNEAWLDEVNRLSTEYRASGSDADVLDLKKHDYSVIAAVRWLEENDLNMLTAQMIYTIRMTGKVELRRAADIQLILEPAEGSSGKTWHIIQESPLAKKDGSVEAEAVILAAPGEALPDIEAWLLIRQGRALDSLIAAQRDYRAELGTVLMDPYAADLQ